MPQEIETDVIIERLDNLIKTNRSEHKVIIDQVKKTNGNTVENAKKINEHSATINKIIGGFVVANVFIVPVILFLLFERLKRGL